MAAHRPVDVTLVSASGLKNVNIFFRMDVYAVAWLSTGPRVRQRTRTARRGGKNPRWDDAAPALRFFVPQGLDPALLTLHVIIRAEGLFRDRDIGEVRVPVRELEPDDAAGADTAPRFVSYGIRRPSGRLKGVLNLSVMFGERVAVAAAHYLPCPPKVEEPVTAYPAPHGFMYPPPGTYPPGGYAGYPQPYNPYSHGVPLPPGYGYAPPRYGYGPAPAVHTLAPDSSNFNMGMGGGMLGGVVLADTQSGAAAYKGGYGAGFAAEGGGDFRNSHLPLVCER